MKSIFRLIVGLFYFSWSIDTTMAQSNPHRELEQLANANFFVVRASSVSAPENKVLIFKSVKEFCAVKIIRHANESADQKILVGDYEIRRANLLAVDFSQVETEHGQFDFSGYSGRMHMSERKGKFLFFCGGSRVIWDYPTTFGTSATGLLFAPTAWNDFSNVKLNDKSIKWFSADSAGRREAFNIALCELPGGERSQ